MNITVLGETYDVSEPVGREYGELCAKGVDELTAARIATGDYTHELPAAKAVQPVTVNVEPYRPPTKVILERDENGRIVGIVEAPA